jgi:hypothetical protein
VISFERILLGKYILTPQPQRFESIVMTLYEVRKNMVWHLENIRFLHPPDDFTGTFSNEKMQARHKERQKHKINDIMSRLESEKHPVKAMRILDPREYIQFLLNNIDLFRQTDSLEETVLSLFYRKNTPFALVGSYEVWKSLFECCDPERIYLVGKPFPYKTITAYRGSATGIAKGLNWTVNKQEVAWILERWQDKSLGGGTVFSLEITRNDILVYTEKDKRQEVILRPDIAETREPTAISSL